jgi:hypothetical protein
MNLSLTEKAGGTADAESVERQIIALDQAIKGRLTAAQPAISGICTTYITKRNEKINYKY